MNRSSSACWSVGRRCTEKRVIAGVCARNVDMGGRGHTAESRCDVVATNDLKAVSQLALSRAERALRHDDDDDDDDRSGLLKGNLSDETNTTAERGGSSNAMVA